MIKEKKISIKYYLGKNPMRTLNGSLVYSLYARITYNRETTKITLDCSSEDGFDIESVVVEEKEIYSLTDVGENLYKRILKPYKNIEKVVRYESNLNINNYSLKGLNQRLDRYSKSVRWGSDLTVILEEVFKNKTSNELDIMISNSMGEGEFGYAEFLNCIRFEIENYQEMIPTKLKNLMIGHFLFRILVDGKPYGVNIYDVGNTSCYDWLINSKLKSKLKKEILKNRFFEKKNFPSGYFIVLKDLGYSIEKVDEYISALDNFISFYTSIGVENSISVHMLYFK